MVSAKPDTKTFTVVGDPAAQGSKRLVRTKAGRTIMLENSKKVRPWRTAVAEAAVASNVRVREGDVELVAVVRFVRPLSHFRTNGEVKPSAALRPGRSDSDKLLRAILDALTGVAYHDDRQVACVAIERVWCGQGEAPGATISIRGCDAAGRWSYTPVV